MDTEKLRVLAESAETRAKDFHIEYQKAFEEGNTTFANSLLNDFFYWSGKATSYRGVIAMIELATIVDDERDATPQCP